MSGVAFQLSQSPISRAETARVVGIVDWRPPTTATASMAAVGLSVKLSTHGGIATDRNEFDVGRAAASLRKLSFTSSNVSGEKLIMSKSSVYGRGCSLSRKPSIVSPKAVSDSQNSQTCLDPDASRVSKISLMLFVYMQS